MTNSILMVSLNMKKLFIALFILFPVFLNSQEMLVSEYYNTGNTGTEWIEIIVTEENLNVVGYKIRDNSVENDSPSQWQGGIEFKDNPIWQNIPKGLIIVIFLREDNTKSYDTDFSDGRIFVNAEDSELFDKFCPTCDTDPSDWEISSFKIAKEADIVQILNENDAHVHAIGHTLNGLGDFQNINGLMTDINLSTGNSLNVFPGNTINQYLQGFDNDQEYLRSSASLTLGEANNKGGFEEDNAEFWHDLRSPLWIDPQLDITKQQVGFLLEWNNLQISNNRDIYGFMIVRSTSEINTEPVDGIFYEVGDLIGSGRVIRISGLDEPTVYNDQTATQCGVTYYYKIYSFKYDNGNQDNIGFYKGLGRSYNEIDVAEASISRNDIPNFNILSLNGETTICYPPGEDPENYSLVLASTLQQETDYLYIWEKDDEVIFEGQNFGEFSQINVSESGRYLLTVINDEDCSKFSSNFLDINIEEQKDYFIGVNERIFQSDTTVFACEEDGIVNLISNVPEDAQVDWYLSNGDGTGDLLQANSLDYEVAFEAEFFAVVRFGDCKDTTNTIELEFQDLQLEFDKETLNFTTPLGLDITNELTIINDGNLPQTFDENDLDLPNEFEIVSPALPFTVKPGESILLELSFNSQTPGFRTDKFIITSDCFKEYEISLRINVFENELSAFPNPIEFPTLVSCGQTGADTTVTIINNGEDLANLSDVAFNEQFRVEGLPQTVQAGEEIEITVFFNTQVPGQYSSTISIPVDVLGEESTIKIAVSGRVAEPKLTLDTNIVNFGLVPLCESSKDTAITVYNNSGVNFTIPDLGVGDFSSVNTPLLVPNGETRQLELRFERVNEGISDAIVNFDIQPCNVSQSFRMIGQKKKLDIRPEIEILNFGDVLICEDILRDTLSSRLLVTESSSQAVIVDSIDTPDYVGISIKKGDELTNGLPFEIFIEIDEEVTISDVVNIRVSPCNNWYQIPVIISTQKPEIVFQDTLRFEDITLPANETSFLDFQNPSSVDIEFILSPIGSNPNFIFDLDDKFIPSELSSPQSFVYQTNVESIDTLLVEVKMTEPCQLSDTLILIGNTFREVPEMANIRLRIKGEEDLTLGSPVVYTIDLIIESEDEDKLELNSTEFSILYNPFVFEANNINANYPEELEIESNNNKKAGEINFRVDFESNEIKDYPELLEFELEPLLGNELISDIRVIGSSAKGNTNFNINSDSLTANISGNCQLEQRLLAITGNVSLNVRGGEINSGNLEIDIEIATSDLTKVRLVNLDSGTNLELLNGSLEPGAYSLILNGFELPSGLYFIEMTSGISKRTAKFIQID